MTVNPNPDEIPHTGDNRMLGVYRLTAVMSLLLMAVFYRRKNQD